MPGFKTPPSKQNLKLLINVILLTVLFHHKDDFELA